MLSFREETDGSFALALPAIVDLSQCEAFWGECIAVARKQQNVSIAADQVEQLSTAVFQILVALEKHLTHSKCQLTILSPSPYFCECMSSLGLDSLLTVRRLSS